MIMKRFFLGSSFLLSVGALLGLAVHAPAQAAPSEAFSGKIGLTRATSQAEFPVPIKAPRNAPNILIIILDDAGFGLSSAFGGDARTPNLEQIAAEGIRYNNFNTTAICAPTRAALLSGRNHHQVGFGNLPDVAAGFPAYNGLWKKETASIARILQLNGYSTAAIGKWHNTPKWEISAAGPFDHWPTHLGFDHFYGFLSGEDNQFEPHLYDDTVQIPAPDIPEHGYHLTNDLVNKSIQWVDNHAVLAGEKPYFLYFATGAVHLPHYAPQEWIERNKGRFDEGWDKYREETFARQKKLGVIPDNAKLTPRPVGLPAWDSLTQEQKHLYAHEMEIYSAYMEHTDAEVGRLVSTLRSRPGGDNLMVFYLVGDNGGSAEGGIDGGISNEASRAAGAPNDFKTVDANYSKLATPAVANSYSAGWAWATSTPFQWMKQIASHFGGTRNPLVVDWPGHTTASGTVRSQFGHVNDIAPTILDVTGIQAPQEIDGVKQIPFEGKSLLPTFQNPAAPETHTEQYFEIFGNRAIYKDGWIAASKQHYVPWNMLGSLGELYKNNPEDTRWELYHVSEDYSEADDLAQKFPHKLDSLKEEFLKEGERNGVFPLMPLPIGAPSIVDKGKKNFIFESDISGVPPQAVPDLVGRNHKFSISITRQSQNKDGIFIAEGGRLGGYVLYEQAGHLAFENNVFGQQYEQIVSSNLLPIGSLTVGYEFAPDPSQHTQVKSIVPKPGDGTVYLTVNGQHVAEMKIHQYPSTIGSFSETFDIGRDRGSKVGQDIASQVPYTGKIGEVILSVQ
ncbi:sulfatase [Gluconobacter frateurii M-2]|nr:sulfatase [Gluconobacter frateurii M-2]